MCGCVLRCCVDVFLLPLFSSLYVMHSIGACSKYSNLCREPMVWVLMYASKKSFRCNNHAISRDVKSLVLESYMLTMDFERPNERISTVT